MQHTKDDFDPKAITQEHQKDIGDLKKRIEELEKKFGTHEQIADTLCITAEKQTKMKDMMGAVLIDLLQRNDSVKNEIKDIVDKTDRNAVMVFVKKVGFLGWSILLAVLGVILGYFLKK